MLHEIEELDKQGLRRFGITTGIIAGILFGLILPYLFGYAWPKWPWILAGVLIIWALILPATLRPVYRAWMTIGGALGWINTRIILGILFFVVFAPISLALWILGKDAMARKIHLPVDSYRVICHERNRDHFERPY
ncbi:MAG: SxtJ family membrane protein [Pseudomonadales bacterium]